MKIVKTTTLVPVNANNTAFGVGGLTPFEAKVARVWDGSVRDTALALGCSPALLQKVLDRPLVQKAVKARETFEGRTTRAIASRRHRQQFWTKVMVDRKVPMRDRLRASELLARSECDFVEKHEVKIEDAFSDLIRRAEQHAIQAVKVVENTALLEDVLS